MNPAHRHLRVRLGRLAGAALLAFGMLASFGAERAAAGAYVVAECDPSLGSGHRDARYEQTSRDFVAAAGCSKGGGGISVGHRRSETLANRFGRWTFAAAPGTRLVAASARAGGALAGGLLPELSVRTAGSLRRIGVVEGLPHRMSWQGEGQALVASLECRRSPRCLPSRRASLRVNRIRLKLQDTAVPSVNFGGSLAGQSVVRDVQRIEASAGDLGGGVQRLSVDVNGHPAGSVGSRCALAGRVALRTVPCPPNALVPFQANTTQSPYRQGVNAVRVCAQDFAARGEPNVRCVTRHVRVDNLCPISTVTSGVQLTVHVAGARHKSAVGRDDRPRVTGRLVDSTGSPVKSARICIAAIAQAPGASEHLLATPTTDAAGRFSARVGPGPARRLRVAYWPGETGAIERFDQIRFRARPALEIHPHDRPLRTGGRANFIVRLRPPLGAGRAVRIEARSRGRWVPVTGGRTGAGGVYRGSYRFHATRGHRVYRFRAAVPRQAGYPYAAGASAVRRTIVRG